MSPSSRVAAALSLSLSLAASFLGGCSSDDEPAGTSSPGTGGGTTTPGGGGAGGAGGAGGEGGAPIGGDRPVEVFVPASYQEGTPAPLVVLLHGYGISGDMQEVYFKLQPLAEQRGFLYAHPDGTVDDTDKQFWNATDACCDFENAGVDDSTYLKRVVDDIKERYTIDPKRVFFLGHSNGGFMSFRMACDHADTIAAIASLAGAMYNDESLCNPSEPVAVLQIHGTADDTVDYNGTALYPSAMQTVQDWVTFDGCDAAPTPGPALDLESQLAGDETTTQAFTGCNPGGHGELWTIEGGGHVPSLSPDFAPAVIDFLFAHPKP